MAIDNTAAPVETVGGYQLPIDPADLLADDTSCCQ